MDLSRKRFTDSDWTLIWDRWQRGESQHQIAQRLATCHSSIRRVLERTGGIRPPPRHRSARALTLAEPNLRMVSLARYQAASGSCSTCFRCRGGSSIDSRATAG